MPRIDETFSPQQTKVLGDRWLWRTHKFCKLIYCPLTVDELTQNHETFLIAHCAEQRRRLVGLHLHGFDIDFV